MVRLIRAVYENGVFRPLETPAGLADRTAVRLRIEEAPSEPGRLSEFAGRWSASDADEISAVIESEFARVNASEW